MRDFMDFNKNHDAVPSINLGNCPYVMPIHDIPHVLIEGMTENRNKYIERLINQLASNYAPSELVISLLGINGRDLSKTHDDAHLFCPNSTTNELATKLVEELERRYSLIWDNDCDGILKFNLKMRKKGESIIPTLIAVCHLDDESYKDEKLFYCIANLLQKGRGAGIHLIISATNLKRNKKSAFIKYNTPMSIVVNDGSKGVATVNFNNEINVLTF